jgi:hypothetical protein
LMLNKHKQNNPRYFPGGGKMTIILQLKWIKLKIILLRWSQLSWIIPERYEFYNLLSTSNKFNCAITTWRQKTLSGPYEFRLIFQFLSIIVPEILKVSYAVLNYKHSL